VLRNGLANSILLSMYSVLCNRQPIISVSLYEITTLNSTFVDFY